MNFTMLNYLMMFLVKTQLLMFDQTSNVRDLKLTVLYDTHNIS